jgi:hypothetical protein
MGTFEGFCPDDAAFRFGDDAFHMPRFSSGNCDLAGDF